jgi:hypothetical protein
MFGDFYMSASPSENPRAEIFFPRITTAAPSRVR